MQERQVGGGNGDRSPFDLNLDEDFGALDAPVPVSEGPEAKSKTAKTRKPSKIVVIRLKLGDLPPGARTLRDLFYPRGKDSDEVEMRFNNLEEDKTLTISDYTLGSLGQTTHISSAKTSERFFSALKPFAIE